MSRVNGLYAVCGLRRTLVLMAVLAMAVFLADRNCAAQGKRGLSDAEVEGIGMRIWQNECGGSVAGLTSWNTGEDFASLGIGHFIWYPEGTTGPFEESFPGLVEWLRGSGVKIPAWLLQARGCPWPNRAAFMKDREGARQKELRRLLSETVVEQTRYIMHRLDQALPRLEAAAGPQARRVSGNVGLLKQTASGNFAMIDYVNFKGEGLSPQERYKGEGWGLLQVLMAMEARSAEQAPRAFAEASKKVLTRRVENSPPERKEKRWLGGWLNRCEAYGR